ncbi:MAG: GerMN domain-containing protein [Christensenellales bacterium]|jgi:germination protein M
MLKKMIAVIMIAGILLLCFAGCGGKKEEEPYEEIPAINVADKNMRQTVLYLENDYGYIVPVMKEIKWVEGIGAAAVSELKANVDTDAEMEYMGLNPILAEDTELSLNIKEGVATIKLSKGAIAANDAIGEMNKVIALVNTLTEFPTIDTVFIHQEGVDGVLPNGTDISQGFGTFDLNVMSNLSSENLANASKILLYFEDASGSAIVPVTKYVGGEANAFVAMNELLKGPGSGGLKNLFPEGTQLLNVNVDQNGVATIEFSEAFSKISEYPEKEQKLLKCIMLTLTQFDNIDEVRILVNGKEYSSTSETTMAYPDFVNTLK